MSTKSSIRKGGRLLNTVIQTLESTRITARHGHQSFGHTSPGRHSVLRGAVGSRPEWSHPNGQRSPRWGVTCRNEDKGLLALQAASDPTHHEAFAPSSCDASFLSPLR